MARPSSSSRSAILPIVALAAVALAAAGNAGDEGGAASSFLRGVDPAAAEAYSRPRFVCDGGATTLESTKINDEYCDCKDGTDEPGEWR